MEITLASKIDHARGLIADYRGICPNSAVAVSFGKDSMVLLHLVQSVDPFTPVFSVLSDTEFPDTIRFKNQIVQNWRLPYTEYIYEQGPDYPLEDCCRSLKVAKFKEAVADLACWFSGIRNDEGATRNGMKEVEEKGGLLKVNPIFNFTEKDIWRYTAIYGIPVNPIYRRGYRSLSCSRCSAVEQDENQSERAGRWQGTKNEGKECGIHSQALR